MSDQQSFDDLVAGSRLAEAFAADYVVIVRRYDAPQRMWGVHAVRIDEPYGSNPHPFRTSTLGLFGDDVHSALLHQIHAADANAVERGDLDAPPLLAFIGDQILPIQMQAQWRDEVDFVVDRVSVFSMAVATDGAARPVGISK